jgi:hypothetical protein
MTTTAAITIDNAVWLDGSGTYYELADGSKSYGPAHLQSRGSRLTRKSALSTMVCSCCRSGGAWAEAECGLSCRFMTNFAVNFWGYTYDDAGQLKAAVGKEANGSTCRLHERTNSSDWLPMPATNQFPFKERSPREKWSTMMRQGT